MSVIANDGFFPDLDLNDFITPYRIPSEYDNTAIINAVVLGIVETNIHLDAFRTGQIAIGFSALEAITEHNSVAGDKDRLTLLYEKAVFAWAKAWLLQQFNAMNRRNTSSESDTAALTTTDYWLNQYKSAIFTLLSLFGMQAMASAAFEADQAHVVLV